MTAPDQSPPWAERELLAYDTETSGVDVETDRIVTAVLVYVVPGQEPEITSWLINPGVEIPQEAIDVHGLTNECVREHGRPPAEVIPEILTALRARWRPGVPLVGHNLTFDLSITDREAQRHCGDSLAVLGPVIDTLTIDRTVWKYVKGSGMRKLEPTCERYGVELKNAHDAEADATAAARLAWAISRKFPERVGLVPLERLHEQQSGWYRAWAVEFASWLDKQAVGLQRAAHFNLLGAVRKMLGEDVEPTPENIAAKLSEFRGKAADVRASANDWPLRPRPVATAEVA